MAGTASEDPLGLEEDLEGEAEDEGRAGHRLPLARIKRIMKADPDLNLASQDAVFLITKATELFVESLVQEAYQFTLKGRKKTVTRRDIDNCVEAIDALAFLDGAMDWT
ncbi:DNA polymerase epsilon subunit 4-like [Eriocheir sinensis]|uniref:DNA polymerase epsilon subunit 4-like n=1 Tax=Eriocheir sinensis TaxID=95602 RepID=UPI0021C69B5D|nr:DNA polymerase epsilon subunit 4-like [Eriocheir sinensis]